MRLLLSTIGSRGDVQPLVALALQLRALGQQARLCVPPDFCEWIAALGFDVVAIGPELRKLTASGSAAPPTPERLRELARATVATQFATITAAAGGCDIIVGATALQIAARSVAEVMRIPYVFAVYCPTVLPSPHHAPPPMLGEPPTTADVSELWARNAARFNDSFGAALDEQRAAIGLTPVTDVRNHVLTERPWLAADPMLGPWPEPGSVYQPGAWVSPNDRPLPDALQTFLHAGEPPIYFGFGSMRAAPDTSRAMLDSARALGRRAIISRGWADLSVAAASDCIAIGEVNHSVLFGRVAAVVHHGGAGTTTAAALAGAPQVVVPQMFDQFYWARRVEELEIGIAHAPGAPTAESLTTALEQALRTDVAGRARSIATAVRSDGAQLAAQRLLQEAP